jgi:hypothetical protein
MRYWIVAVVEAWLWEQVPDRRARWLNSIFSAIWLLGTMALLMGVMTLVLWGGAQH